VQLLEDEATSSRKGKQVREKRIMMMKKKKSKRRIRAESSL
jgi:hypothetical protein